jgi:uncharacterized protein DUF3187
VTAHGPLRGLSVAVFVAASATSASGQPIESRDEFLLAQPRLTLPATSPDLLKPGSMQMRMDFDWGNDFGWDQEFPGEFPGDRRFIVDGEHRTLALSLRRGLSDRWDVGARLPLRWRGPGILDGVIDWWHHRVLAWLGPIDNGRSLFRNDQFRVEGRDEEFRPVRLLGGTGTGFGKLELELHRSLSGSSGSGGWRTAAVARVALPTGTGPFAGGGLDAGLQLLAARELGAHFEVYAGAGGTAFTQEVAQGIAYAPTRAHAFLVLEWRASHAVGVLAETSFTSRLVTNLAAYPGVQQYLKLGSTVALGHRWTLEGGFTEGLIGQQATTDFGIMTGVVRRFR